MVWNQPNWNYTPWHFRVGDCLYRADSRRAPSQWEVALLCNDVFHWLGAHQESALLYVIVLSAYIAHCNAFHPETRLFAMDDRGTYSVLRYWKYVFPDIVILNGKFAEIIIMYIEDYLITLMLWCTLNYMLRLCISWNKRISIKISWGQICIC